MMGPGGAPPVPLGATHPALAHPMAVSEAMAEAPDVPGRLTLVMEGKAKNTAGQGVRTPPNATVEPSTRTGRAEVPVTLPVTRRTAAEEIQGARGGAGGAVSTGPRAMGPIRPLEEGTTRRGVRRTPSQTESRS